MVVTPQAPCRHCTGPPLQHSALDVHDPPTPTQATFFTSTQTPCWQKPLQHSKPFAQVPAKEPASAAPASSGGPAPPSAAEPGVAMQLASVQKPRMLGVSSWPSR